MKPATAYIGVGSNIEPTRNILKALSLLAEYVAITGVSTFYQTAAIGRPEQDDYLNGVVRVRTDQTPQQLHELLHDIERISGRVHMADKFAPRTIDLDVLLLDSVVLQEGHLELPAKDIERPFVAIPLLELDPQLRLPHTGQPLSSLVSQMERDLKPACELNQLLREAPWI